MTRSRQNIRWIHRYCVTPLGARVRLSNAEKETLRLLYDDHAQLGMIKGRLAAYLALLHICGIEATSDEPSPDLYTDIFTIWHATSPDLRRVLKREGAAVVCPELGTRFAAA